jgi:hypothetical protein
MPRKSRQKNPVVLVLRSGPFLCAVAAVVLLGASSLGKVWHENRNVLLQGEIRRLNRRIENLKLTLVDLRVQKAQAVSPAGIREQLAVFGLDLTQPAEDQILRLDEPDWPERLAASTPSVPPSPHSPATPSGATLATTTTTSSSVSAPRHPTLEAVQP